MMGKNIFEGAKDLSMQKQQQEVIEDVTVRMASPALAGKYVFLKTLGEGAQGVTYTARVVETGEIATVKVVPFAAIDDWKQFELCEREAKLLGDIDHPNVPKLYEVVLDDEGEDAALYIVREYCEGESLQQMLDAGHHFSEDEIFDFWWVMVDVLAMLQAKNPPIVHRDIKPSNIIRDADGGYKLIDFGAAGQLSMNTAGGSTIAGTFGFMPPEQYMGKATIASDIYALAATVAYLYSGVKPADMVAEDLRLDIGRYLSHVDRRVVALLEQMLEPVPHDRLCDVDMIRTKLVDIHETTQVGQATAGMEAFSRRWEFEKEIRLKELEENEEANMIQRRQEQKQLSDPSRDMRILLFILIISSIITSLIGVLLRVLFI